MGSKTVKTALIVAAVATGFAAIPAIGASGAAMSVGGALGFSGTTAGLVGTFIISAGSQLVLGAVNRKLAPDIDIPEIGTNLQQGTMVTAKSGVAPQRVIYGKTRVGGTMVYAESTGSTNEFLHIIITVAGHEINNITKVFFNEDEVPLTQDGSDSNGIARFFPSSGNQYEGKARIKKHFGIDAQLADADLVSEISQWTTNHRLRGISYLYVRLNFDKDVYTNGVPNITFEVEGRKVFDPRSSATAFSTNPALCIRDYLLNERFGLEADSTEINDTNFTAVANTCDENVTIANPSGTEKRFSMNGTFTLSKSPKVILENMLSSIAGNMIYSNGQFKLRPAVYESPSVTLDEEHIRSGITLNTRISKKELFNAVKGLYSEPANNYQPQDYPVLTNSSFESEDNSERIFGEFNFPMTTSSHTVQRLSKIQLLKARQQISFTATFNLKAFQLDIGDTVQITNSRLGFTNKTFEITNWAFAMGGDGIPTVACEFRETASAVYDFATTNYSTVSSGKATNLPKSNSVSAPTAITLTDELVSYNDGTVIVKMVIVLTEATNNFTELYEIEIKQLTDADGNAVTDDFKQIGRGARTKYEFLNVIDRASYQVRARGVNIFGVNSSTITQTHTVVGLSAPPPNVENFACNIVGLDAFLSWQAVDVLDLSYYELRYQNVTSNATWGSSVPLVKKVSRPGTSTVVPAKTGAYLIKARDKLGNPSVDATVVFVAVETIGNFNALTSSTQHPDFTGTKTNIYVSDDIADTPALVLNSQELFDSPSGNFDSQTVRDFDSGTLNAQLFASGTYDFNGTIDVGSKIKTNVNASIVQVVTDVDDLFDNTTGNFDTRLGNFDGDAEANCSSELQIAISDDNSSFSAFQTFVVGDYFARYYKFRMVMTSANGSATPVVTELKVTLDMEDRIESGNNIVSGTGTKSVTFTLPFVTIPALGFAVQNMASGDTYTLSNKTATGFDVAFLNSSGSGVSRTFDFIAKGF